MQARKPRLSALAVATLVSCLAATSAEAQGAAEKKFVSEAILGEYVDLRNWQRMWIDDLEVHKVAFEAKTRSATPAEGLRTQQLVHDVLKLRADAQESSVRSLLKQLQDRGVEPKCYRTRVQWLATSAAQYSATLRYQNPVADKVVDMLVVRSDRWSATYLAFRSRELDRAGALPMWDDKESEASKGLPLDALPFTASNIVYRVSGQRSPGLDWCLK